MGEGVCLSGTTDISISTGWRFFGLTDQVLRLTFPSGRMTLAVHITERLTALLPKLYLYLLSAMAGPCAHEDDERETATLLTQNRQIRNPRHYIATLYLFVITHHPT